MVSDSSQISEAAIRTIRNAEYHKRRKMTAFLCGFQDLEEEVVDLIRNTKTEVQNLKDQISELQRSMREYKQAMSKGDSDEGSGLLAPIKAIVD